MVMDICSLTVSFSFNPTTAMAGPFRTSNGMVRMSLDLANIIISPIKVNKKIGRASCRERVKIAVGDGAEDGIRDFHVTGVQTCALPILTTKISLRSLP